MYSSARSAVFLDLYVQEGGPAKLNTVFGSGTKYKVQNATNSPPGTQISIYLSVLPENV
jgi:hypothetical protein